MKTMKMKNIFLLISLLASVLLQSCLEPPASMESIKVDFDAVNMMSEEDAYDVLQAIISPRSKDSLTTCRVSSQGLSTSTDSFVTFKDIKFSYALAHEKQAGLEYPVANFHRKSDGSKICRVTVSATKAYQNQMGFDWQEKLLTNSMVALGAELAQ